MANDNTSFGSTAGATPQAGMRIPDTTARTRPVPEVRRDHQTSAPPLVLVAEDVPEMRSLLVTALERAGYRVQACGDGWDLLNRLKSYLLPIPREERVDLVVSDIRMPGLTGLEVLEGAEGAPDFPPMILITAFGDAETHRQAICGGAVALLDKPFDLDDLVALARRTVPLN